MQTKLCACLILATWLALSGGVETAAAQRTLRIRRDEGPRLVLREVLRIGSLDGADAFGRVTDVAFDGGGRLYVVDDLNRRVSVVGADGRVVGQLGREGSGPGEFQAPWLVRVAPGDSAFVWDASLARVSVFGPDLRFRRSFRTSPAWMVTGIEFLPSGDLVVAAFGSGERHPLHRLTRTGVRRGSFGPDLGTRELGGFERSLLGGYIDLDGADLVYTNKSPYEVAVFSTAGQPRLRCQGERDWVTAPEAAVEDDGAAQTLRWNTFVHSSRIIAMGNGLYLNVVHDPRRNRKTVDLLTSDCRLVRRTSLELPLFIADRWRSRLATVRTLDYPEVVVYEMELVGQEVARSLSN